MTLTKVSELVLALIDVIRAEISDARFHLVHLATAICLVLVAAALLFSAMALGLSSVYLALAFYMPPALSLLLTAIVSGLAAAVVLGVGYYMVSSK